MSIVAQCRELIKYSAARQPVLVIPESRFDEFMQATCNTGFCPSLLDAQGKFDGTLVRCLPNMAGDPQVIDAAP